MRVTVLALLSLPVLIVGATSCAERKPPSVVSAAPASRDAPGYSLTTPNLILPKILKPATPRYTAEAMRAKVTGEVELLIRIGADGSPERARVSKSLDKVHGLDEQAMFAAGRSLFEPATLNGKAVPVDDVPITMSFKIY